ncbi:DNA polymerase Y family protein [Leucobacter ruminantium]|uniref:DNA polymerase Y family protein n=1 Tax=Leucobacter ruminantium TaxID=1289170 RepID=A0A939M049_9MICO|nr:DNA polymerase Y family protein [Leucobacter ruminantium]MBO1806113.1 DNA polymerase Y family protein [Leucobacter ruminantium]
MSTATAPERTLVLWIPDWPVRAHAIERAAEEAPPLPPTVALVSQRRVVACSAAARAEGVRPGLSEREAQFRCADAVILPHDPEVDERRFAPVIAALERIIPGVSPLRPGLCAMRARGPARYYGGEDRAAAEILRLAESLELPDARIGIADGWFAAEQAARSAADAPGIESPAPGIRIVAAGGSRAFLSPLPVSRAADPRFAEVLRGLGIRTLGSFAALPEEAVRQRFGATGTAVHRRASAAPPAHGSELRPRTPARELAATLDFEPPLDAAEQLAFACAALSERFVEELAEERLVCTSLRVELTDDIGLRHERVWSHPRRFTAADVVNRIRWQSDTVPRDPERNGAGIVRVRLSPVHTDRAAAHEPGLWSTGPDERVHHHLSRVQSRIGHTGVGTVRITGGRLLAERQQFTPWATAARDRRSATGPWPGSLPAPHPSEVFAPPVPAELLDDSGLLVGIDCDELLDARPARLRVGEAAGSAPVAGWSQPWALRERWWRGVPERFRLQVQLGDGDAWLLLHQGGRWFAEGRYD